MNIMNRISERQTTQSISKRNPYFEAIRGIAIMMVVAIHTFIMPNDIADNPVVGYITLGVRQIFNAAVPLFLAISGFFLAKKQLTYNKGWWTPTKRQILKVYIPVLVWSLPLLAIDTLRGQFTWWSILSYFLCGFSVYYFVLLITQFYLLAPALQSIKNKPLLIISGVGNLVALIFVTYVANKYGFHLPFLVHAGGL